MTRSVYRAIAILDTISHHSDGIGVNEIARQTDLHKSTVSRLLITLEEEEMVQRVDDGFTLGQRLYAMSTMQHTAVSFLPIVQPFLQDLCTQIGEDIGLAIPVANGVRYVAQVKSEQQAVQVRDWTDTQFEYHVTSSGKLMMAFWSEQKLDAFLQRPLTPFSSGTLTDPAKLRAAIALIRTTKCDWTQNEFADGFSAVSAPIFDTDGQVQAAINIYAPSFRFPMGKKEEITRLILAVGRQLTERLGGDIEMFER